MIERVLHRFGWRSRVVRRIGWYVRAGSVVVPVIPAQTYANLLLHYVSVAAVAVLPYAAGVCALVVGVRMIRRYLGALSAGSLSSPRVADYDEYDYRDDEYRVVYHGETYDKYSNGAGDGYLAHHSKGIGGPRGMRY